MGLEADHLEQQLESRDPDVRLMIQVRNDIPGAFETLVERYQNRLVGILFHLVGNLQEAEDLCQEVFLRIYKARKGYRPRSKFSTWLFTIANNLALNHLRSKGRSSGLCPRLVQPAAQRRLLPLVSSSRLERERLQGRCARLNWRTWFARPLPCLTKIRRWRCCSTSLRK